MERRRNQALRQQNAGVPTRAAYYEDHAKPAWVSAPFMAVAAAAFLIAGHLLNRRPGRRPGGDGRRKGGGSGSCQSSSSGDNEEFKRGNQPMSLADLRLLRAEAAEARLQKGELANGSPAAVAKPTPLGSILMLARQVDKLEEESSSYLSSLAGAVTLDSTAEKEQSRLLEFLTQVQLKIDGVKSDESVRPHRKTQTQRVQALIMALEKVGYSASTAKESSSYNTQVSGRC